MALLVKFTFIYIDVTILVKSFVTDLLQRPYFHVM